MNYGVRQQEFQLITLLRRPSALYQLPPGWRRTAVLLRPRPACGERRPRVRAAQAPSLASSAPPRALRATRSNAAFAWLLRDRAAPGSYAPQLGDEVAYIARGHWEHLSGRNDKRASRPWRFVPGLRHVEPAKVVQLRYRISQDGRDETVARMRLKLADPGSENRGAEFDVDLPLGLEGTVSSSIQDWLETFVENILETTFRVAEMLFWGFKGVLALDQTA